MTEAPQGSARPVGLPADWPHHAASRLVMSRPHRWHVQVMGEGPVLLMLHGAGGAGMSWRGLMPLLAGNYRLVVPDLPGQGYTRAGRSDRFGLDAMAEDLLALCARLEAPPMAVIGHSAGGAIALRLAELAPLRAVVGVNAALGVFGGLAGVMFPFLARTLHAAPFVPQLVAQATGTTARVAALLASTGSRVDGEGVELYRHLVARHAHVEGTLAMMAQWRLEGLLARLEGISVPTLLVTGAGDRTVEPEVSSRAAARMPQGATVSLPGLGHLAQEEDAGAVAAAVLPFLADRVGKEGAG
ncbi:MAG: alpha/beta fold hydrolase BchO [Gemmobacter sp.]